MSQAPMMPIFVDALIGDTLDLSAEEFGAYLLLLFATWRNNGRPLPDDARKLARICRCPTARWNRVLRPALIGFFRRDDDGFLHQKRLEKEWRICEKYRGRQFQNGSHGGRPRKSDKRLETQETGEPNGSVWRNPDKTQTKPSHTLVEEEDNLALKELNYSSSSTAREASPPLPSRGDGDAATRAPNPKARDGYSDDLIDPAEKAAALAELHRTFEAVRVKAASLNGHAEAPE